MLVARNRSSGKYFIVIDHLTDGRLFCVNPENRIRPLSEKLFDEVIDEDIDKLISCGHITVSVNLTPSSQKSHAVA